MASNSTRWMLLVAAVLAGVALTYWGRSGDHSGQSIKLPQLTSEAKAGRQVFEAKCMTCHGKNATGTKSGPPLVHKIYEPSHHSDMTFYRAVAHGVRQHHWPFGNMPPIPDVQQDEVSRIIIYVRELQRANGIH